MKPTPPVADSHTKSSLDKYSVPISLCGGRGRMERRIDDLLRSVKRGARAVDSNFGLRRPCSKRQGWRKDRGCLFNKRQRVEAVGKVEMMDGISREENNLDEKTKNCEGTSHEKDNDCNRIVSSKKTTKKCCSSDKPRDEEIKKVNVVNVVEGWAKEEAQVVKMMRNYRGETSSKQETIPVRDSKPRKRPRIPMQEDAEIDVSARPELQSLRPLDGCLTEENEENKLDRYDVTSEKEEVDSEEVIQRCNSQICSQSQYARYPEEEPEDLAREVRPERLIKPEDDPALHDILRLVQTGTPS